MHRLYEKSEIWFAVSWIGVYVFGMSAADAASAAIGIKGLFSLIFALGLSLAALLWSKKHRLWDKYGLCLPKLPAARFLWYLPLAAAVSSNLWQGVGLSLSAAESVLTALTMLAVGFLEEFIFRGLLYKAMCRSGGEAGAAIVSSLTFALGHIINLFNANAAGILPTLCQIVGAAAFGALFVIIFRRGGSILPCIAAHSVLNALSVFSAAGEESTVWVSAAITLIAALYGLILLKMDEKERSRQHEEA